MALTLSEIQALTDDAWLPGSYDNWTKGNVLMFKMLEKVEKIGSCEKIRAVLEHARARGGAMGASTLFNTAKKAVLNAARFDWSMFWAGVTYDIEDDISINGGSAEVDFLMAKLDNAQTSIRDFMGDSLWTAHSVSLTTYGGETKPFYGVPDMLSSSDSTSYGGITPTDLMYPDGENSLWLAYSLADALTMNFVTMQVLRRGCSVSNSVEGKPDIYVTTEELRDAYEASLQPAQRHTSANLAEAGFENVKVGTRAALVADDKCPASSVNGFNTKYLYLKAHKDKFFDGPHWKEPTNQATKTAQIIFAGSFLTSQRRAQGRLTNVS